MNACSILTLAPYRVLPATTGGHWGIVSMHNAIGHICQDHLIGTADNGSEHAYSFQVHRVYPAAAKHYLPYYGLSRILAIARRYDATAIFCDHPYLAPTAIALSRRLRIPWFLRSHNIESLRFHTLKKWWWRGMHEFERAAMRRAHGVFFITPEEREWAIYNYGINPARAHLAPYGTALQAPPGGEAAAKNALSQQLGLDPAKPWLYFLGAMGYSANYEGVRHILADIYPLLKKDGIDAPILIAGKGLPEDLQQAILATNGDIRYLGFVDDLDTFIKACDVMLNPVLIGGGIKTKAVEALAYNKLLVSTVNGASGIDPQRCGPNMATTPNGDWNAFVTAITAMLSVTPAIPPAYYEFYNWDNIAQHVTDVIKSTPYR